MLNVVSRASFRRSNDAVGLMEAMALNELAELLREPEQTLKATKDPERLATSPLQNEPIVCRNRTQPYCTQMSYYPPCLELASSAILNEVICHWI
jgi:hypothetical protein